MKFTKNYMLKSSLLLATFLSVGILTSTNSKNPALSTRANAEEVDTSADSNSVGTINYSMDSASKTASVVSFTGTQSNVNIPKQFVANGIKYTVTSIASKAFYENTGIQSVTIPDTVTSIGDNAFNSSSLENIKMPAGSITSIGDYAFANTKLSYVWIPGSVKSIGKMAFYNCQLTKADITSGVQSIGWNAFQNNKLTSVSLPNSVTDIAGWAFANNDIETVNLSKSLASIGDGSFFSNKITKLIIPSSVSSIGAYAFQYNNLQKFQADSELSSIGDDAFANNNLVSISFSGDDGIQSIGKSSFYGNDSVSSASLPNQTSYYSGNDDASFSSATKITAPSEELDKASAEKAYTAYANSRFVDDNGTIFVNSSDSSTSQTAISEAQGYGMLITAVAPNADQATFQKLYQYYLDNRYSNTQLMNWEQNITTGVKYQNNATDGDLYIAYALLKAGARYNNSAYTNQGKALLSDILKYDYNPTEKILTTGNWATSGQSYDTMRTSDFLPAFFDEFYTATGDTTWKTIKSQGYNLLSQISALNTSGLIPDFIVVSNGVASAPSSVDIESQNYYAYNACRLPLNLAMSNDSQAKNIEYKFLSFLNGQATIYAGYNINGTAQAEYQDSAFLAPLQAANQSLGSIYNNVHQQASDIGTSVAGNSYYSDSQRALYQLLPYIK